MQRTHYHRHQDTIGGYVCLPYSCDPSEPMTLYLGYSMVVFLLGGISTFLSLAIMSFAAAPHNTAIILHGWVIIIVDQMNTWFNWGARQRVTECMQRSIVSKNATNMAAASGDDPKLYMTTVITFAQYNPEAISQQLLYSSDAGFINHILHLLYIPSWNKNSSQHSCY